MSHVAELPPHQAPVTGRFRRWLGPFHYTGIFWYWFPVFGVKVLPRWAVGIFVGIFTPIFFLCLGAVRRAIISNLAVVMGPCGWWQSQKRAWRTLWNFAWCLTERYEALAKGRTIETRAEGDEHWYRIAEAGEGFVLVTAHIGHWEVGSMAASSKKVSRVHVVREEEMNARAQGFLQGLFDGLEDNLFEVHFAREDPSIGVQLLQALRRGEIVAMQGDRPRAGAKAASVEAFGKPFWLPPGPATLARAAEVVIQPVFSFREKRLQTRVVFRPTIRVPRTKDREADLLVALQQMAAEVEWAIREDPYQWFCFRELWPKEEAA